MNIKDKYFVRYEKKKIKEGCWEVLDVSIYQRNEDGSENKIGGYLRWYPSLFDTFVPFIKDDKEYALFSADYTKVSVMELPSCRVIATAAGDFCPMEFYVPTNLRIMKIINGSDGKFDHIDYEGYLDGQIGFMSGCYWGDDSGGPKMQFLDLSQIENGILTYDDRFGYFELPGKLEEVIQINMWGNDHISVDIGHINKYDLNLKQNTCIKRTTDIEYSWLQEILQLLESNKNQEALELVKNKMRY